MPKKQRVCGSGFRGGTWNNDTTNSRVSDRNNAANTNTDRNNNNGGRLGKTFSAMKIRDLFPSIISYENLYRAAKAAAQGKRYRDPAALFSFRLEDELVRLRRELKEGAYRPGAYRTLTIFEPKEREIVVAPFRDRVVHHAVHDIIEPYYDRTFIHDTYACRRGKGTHAALQRARYFAGEYPFVLHADIRKYFPSIDHSVLKGLLRQRIMDRPLLRLLERFVDSADTINPVRGVGVPIGNLTSQFFANLYLDGFDHWCKERLGLKAYVRYMDDILVFGDRREALMDIRARLGGYLRDRRRLSLHQTKTQVHRIDGGFTFLGFRIFPADCRLATRNVRRQRVRLRRMAAALRDGRLTLREAQASWTSWRAHAAHARAGALARMLEFYALGDLRGWGSDQIRAGAAVLMGNGCDDDPLIDDTVEDQVGEFFKNTFSRSLCQ